MRFEGKVIPVAHGEAIVCEIPLGVCKLVVISNIPEEGDRATVFVKVRPLHEKRVPGFRKQRREQDAAPENDNDFDVPDQES